MKVRIIVAPDEDSLVEMDYGLALLTQKGGWTAGEMGSGSEELETDVYTKLDFEKALKKVSRNVKKSLFGLEQY